MRRRPVAACRSVPAQTGQRVSLHTASLVDVSLRAAPLPRTTTVELVLRRGDWTTELQCGPRTILPGSSQLPVRPGTSPERVPRHTSVRRSPTEPRWQRTHARWMPVHGGHPQTASPAVVAFSDFTKIGRVHIHQCSAAFAVCRNDIECRSALQRDRAQPSGCCLHPTDIAI